MSPALHPSRRGARHSATLPLLIAVLVAGLLAGCGSSGSSSTGVASHTASSTTAGSSPTTSSTATASTGTAAPSSAQITRDWKRFFAASTPTSEREKLLQDGSRFASALAAQSKNPLAAQSAAKVTKVTVTGPTTATVTYDILLAGKPALTGQKGTAIRSGGTWKVSDASFCALLGLEGGAPAACQG